MKLDPHSTWQLQHAKACLSELIRAAGSEPQIITQHGRPVAAVMPYPMFRRFSRKWLESEPQQAPEPQQQPASVEQAQHMDAEMTTDSAPEKNSGLTSQNPPSDAEI